MSRSPGIAGEAIDPPPPGPEIARGRASAVYDLGDGTVLRRYLTPGADVEAEATVMTHARTHGVPTPRIHRSAGTDIIMDHVEGITMLDDLMRRPERAPEHGKLLADLHHSLDGVRPPGAGSGGRRLLHLDLHPGNVMLIRSDGRPGNH